MGLTVRPEPVTREAFAEAMALLRRNYDETGAWSPTAFAPDVQAYLGLWINGNLLYHVARDADGALVGYSVMVLGPHPHYDGEPQATQDALYVAPGYRHGSAGVRLIRQSDALARRAGAHVAYRQSTPHREISPLLERLGYHAMDTTYGRRL